MTFHDLCFVGFGIAGIAALPDVNSISNGKSSPGVPGFAGPGFPAGGFAPVGEGLFEPGGEGFGVFESIFAGGFAPGFPFIEAPQNGQSIASSSITD